MVAVDIVPVVSGIGAAASGSTLAWLLIRRREGRRAVATVHTLESLAPPTVDLRESPEAPDVGAAQHARLRAAQAFAEQKALEAGDRRLEEMRERERRHKAMLREAKERELAEKLERLKRGEYEPEPEAPDVTRFHSATGGFMGATGGFMGATAVFCEPPRVYGEPARRRRSDYDLR